MQNSKEVVLQLANKAGITIGHQDGADIEIHDERFYARVLKGRTLALGESYMDGWWDSDDLDGFLYKIINADIKKFGVKDMANLLMANFVNFQTKSKAKEVADEHYDLGNDIFERMLDKRLVYTCAYWKDSATLDEAQEAKLDLVCKKIGLKKGMRILDIGCGWGSFLKYAAEKYGVSGVGITISSEQADLAIKVCSGLPIEIKIQDYRDIEGQFDAVVSIGMFEHVGYKNYREYMKIVHTHLKDDGLFLLHTIGRNFPMTGIDPWMNKYIFPNAVLPSVSQIGSASEKLFVMEDWHNFGTNYDKTLMAWLENFTKNWPEIESKYGKRFFRMWKYYLCGTAATFRARKIQLWQIVFSKHGVRGGYISIR